MFPESIPIGPLSIPTVILFATIAVAGGYLFLGLLTRKRRKSRKRLWNMGVNALLIGLLVWKVSPLINHLSLIVEEPLLLLYYPGGILGTVLGASAAGGYLVRQKIKHRYPFAFLAPLLGALLTMGIVFTVLNVFFLQSEIIFLKGTPSVGTDIGDRAPPTVLTGLSGKQYNISEYRGDIVILNFWATWCPPCRAEIPELKRFYNERIKPKKSGVEVRLFAVNLTTQEQSLEEVRRFTRDNSIPFPVLLDSDGKAASSYDIRSIPTTYVIGPEGIIRAKKSGLVTYRRLLRYTSSAEDITE